MIIYHLCNEDFDDEKRDDRTVCGLFIDTMNGGDGSRTSASSAHVRYADEDELDSENLAVVHEDMVNCDACLLLRFQQQAEAAQ